MHVRLILSSLLYFCFSFCLEAIVYFLSIQLQSLALLTISPIFYLLIYSLMSRYIVKKQRTEILIYNLFFVIIPFTISLIFALIIIIYIKLYNISNFVQLFEGIGLYMISLYLISFQGLTLLVSVPNLFYKLSKFQK